MMKVFVARIKSGEKKKNGQSASNWSFDCLKFN